MSPRNRLSALFPRVALAIVFLLAVCVSVCSASSRNSWSVGDHRVRCIAFSGSGRLIASGDDAGVVSLWDAASGRKLAALPAWSQPIESLAFSLGGHELLAGSWHDVLNDGAILVFDLDRRKLVKRIILPNSNDVQSLACSADGSLLAAGSDFNFTLIDTRTWKPVQRIEGACGPVAFSPAGAQLAAVVLSDEGGPSNDIGLWDALTGKRIAAFTGHWDAVASVAFSRDGRRLLAASSDACAKVWNVASGKEIGQLNHTLSVSSAAFGDIGRWIATAGNDGEIKLWSASTFAKLAVLRAASSCLAVSPDSRRLAIGDENGNVRVWDTADILHGKARQDRAAQSRPSHGSGQAAKMTLPAWRLAFVRDGNVWIANGDGSGQRLVIRDGEAPCWSPDKRRIAFTRFGNIWVARANGSGQRPLTTCWKRRSPSWGSGEAENDQIGIAWSPLDPFVVYSHREDYTLSGDSVTADDGGKTRTIPGVSLFTARTDSRGATGKQPIYGYDSGGTGYLFSTYTMPAFSRDGRQLAFACNGDVWVASRGDYRGLDGTKKSAAFDDWEWDLTRVAAPASFDAPNYRGSRENLGVTRLSWSPDGDRLAYGMQRLGGSGYREVHVLTMKAHSAPRDTTCVGDGCDPVYSPDGKDIAYFGGYERAGVRVVSVDGRSSLLLIGDASEPAW